MNVACNIHQSLSQVAVSILEDLKIGLAAHPFLFDREGRECRIDRLSPTLSWVVEIKQKIISTHPDWDIQTCSLVTSNYIFVLLKYTKKICHLPCQILNMFYAASMAFSARSPIEGLSVFVGSNFAKAPEGLIDWCITTAATPSISPSIAKRYTLVRWLKHIHQRPFIG